LSNLGNAGKIRSASHSIQREITICDILAEPQIFPPRACFYRARRPHGRHRLEQRARCQDESLSHPCFCQVAQGSSGQCNHLQAPGEFDKVLLTHDSALSDIYQKLRLLLLPPPDPPKKEIGFHTIK